MDVVQGQINASCSGFHPQLLKCGGQPVALRGSVLAWNFLPVIAALLVAVERRAKDWRRPATRESKTK